MTEQVTEKKNKTALDILNEYQPVKEVVVPFTLGSYQGQFTFNPTVQDHNDFINTSSGSKVSPTAAGSNYLVKIVDKEQKEELALFLQKVPGGLDYLIAEMVGKFMPNLEADFLD